MSPVSLEFSERELVNRIVRGEQAALAELFRLHRERLWRIINFRLDRRLRGRVDADDVLQEAYLTAAARQERFLQDAAQSCFVWLRLIVSQTLVNVHRRHLGVQMREARRELPLDGRWDGESTSASLAFHLSARISTPSKAAQRAEQSEQIAVALDSLSERDREVLALRHFEDLSNRETALVLGISEQAASNAYVRALARLKKVMAALGDSL
jgi:RNA polymerase sigma-70 factor (ECF subfamily)